MNKSTPFLDSNETTSCLILSEDERKSIGESNIIILEDLLNNKDLKVVLNYLKLLPQQTTNIIELLWGIGRKNTIYLINNINPAMLRPIIEHVNVLILDKVFKKYYKEEIIETINSFNYYNVNSEGKNHVLIQALNKGKLPGPLAYMKNLGRRTKRTVQGILQN